MRWIHQIHEAEVLRIAKCTAYPWTAEQLGETLRKRKVTGTVAENQHGSIVGYEIHRVCPDSLEVIALAVRHCVRGKGVGRALYERLANTMRWHALDRMVARVRETDDAAVKFWTAMGTRAVGVDRGYYRDTGEDAYRFERWHGIPARDRDMSKAWGGCDDARS